MRSRLQSRRVGTSWVLWGICCSLFLASPAAAQRPIDQICSANLVDQAVPAGSYWGVRHPPRTTEALRESEQQGKWDASIGELVRLFAADVQFFDSNRAQHDSMSARLQQFREGVQSTDNAGRSTGIAGAVDFNVRPRGAGYNVLNTRLQVDDSFSEDQLRSLCYAAHSVRRYHERLTRWAAEASEMELLAIATRWKFFNEVGMTPYPWELMGNRLTGWLGSAAPLAPPRRQLILLRPQVGVELDSHFNERENVVAVEILGAVQYLGSRGWYVGGSLLWTSPSEGASGLGVMAHVAQWFKGGPVWRDQDGDGDRELGWMLTVDVFDLFKGAPSQLLDAANAAAEAAGTQPPGGSP